MFTWVTSDVLGNPIYIRKELKFLFYSPERLTAEQIRKTRVKHRLIRNKLKSSVSSINSQGTGIKKTLLNRLLTKKACFSLGAFALFFVLPYLSGQGIARSDQEALYSPTSNLYNSQTLTLLNSKARPDPKGPVGGEDPLMTDNEALVANMIPSIEDTGKAEKIVSASPDDISVYTVREGDTLGQIAEMFGISPNTIRWANDIDVKGTVKPGQELIILPISGIKHKVVKGDTFASIAKKYKADAREISLFNGIEEAEVLVAGTEIIIPNGEEEQATVVAKKPTTKGAPSKEAPSGYYIKPVKGIKTQGVHDRYKAIDIGAKTGTPIWAMASGRVIVVKPTTAYNGGYGGLVIIGHDNGTQTLYAHLSRIDVKQGQSINQGDVLGAVGSTGRSTGPHLHVEIRTGNSGINGLSILEKMY